MSLIYRRDSAAQILAEREDRSTVPEPDFTTRQRGGSEEVAANPYLSPSAMGTLAGNRAVGSVFGAAAVGTCSEIRAATENSGSCAPSPDAPSPKFEKNRYRLSKEQYFPERQKKDLIVLHFTAGTSCDSAYRTWQSDVARIATAYGVEPDGTIVEFFPPEEWAYHLGVKGTHQHDRRSIGIEIANPGPLQLDASRPGQLNWWPKNFGTRYCSVAEEDRYVRATYRGMDYFAVMPVTQQQAVGSLVRLLCEQFSIPREASDAARRGDYDLAGFGNYKGVASHSNFRRDKWDVGPAFNWDCLGF